jgi:hypothetical protein
VKSHEEIDELHEDLQAVEDRPRRDVLRQPPGPAQDARREGSR